MQLTDFPRVRIAHLPTPLEPLKRLTAHLGGAKIFVKRDDCTGLAFGGNKTRKLEFLMAEALARDADTIITTGGVQSNHVRQTAAAAAHLGLKCELVLARTVPWNGADYEVTGNIQIDRLLGAKVHLYPGDQDREQAMDEVSQSIVANGGRPYLIPSGGSNAVGALGYVNCLLELEHQADELDLRIDALVHATGSAGTQAGLIAGAHGSNSGIRIIGIDIDAEAAAVERKVRELAQETACSLGLGPPAACATQVRAGFAGDAYGMPTNEMVRAVELTAREEGLLLDPVYTGKAMAGLIALIKSGEIDKTENVVFLHTGGMPGLFAYRDAFEAA